MAVLLLHSLPLLFPTLVFFIQVLLHSLPLSFPTLVSSSKSSPSPSFLWLFPPCHFSSTFVSFPLPLPLFYSDLFSPPLPLSLSLPHLLFFSGFSLSLPLPLFSGFFLHVFSPPLLCLPPFLPLSRFPSPFFSGFFL